MAGGGGTGKWRSECYAVDITSRVDVAVYILRYRSSVLSGGPPK